MARAHLPRWFAVAAMATAGVVATPGVASAARPTFHDKFSETIPGVDICGFLTTLRVKGTQTFWFTENRVKSTGQVTQVFTTATGESVVVKAAGQVTSTFAQDGDIVTFVDSFKGLPEKISARGQGGTVLRDAGFISIRTTVNLATGDVTTDVVIKGPHPEAESDFTLFCDAISSVLG